MYKIKRLLCEILVFVLISSTLPCYVFAVEDDITINENLERIEQAVKEDDEDKLFDADEDTDNDDVNNEEIGDDQTASSEPTSEPEQTESSDVDENESTTAVESGIKYSELSADEQQQVQDEYGIGVDIIEDCEAVGLDLNETLSIGQTLQIADITVQEYMTLRSYYETVKEANEQLEKFANCKYMFPELEITGDNECKSLFISGTNCLNIISAKVISNMIDADSISEYLNVTDEEIAALLNENDYNIYINIIAQIAGVSEMVDDEDEEESEYDLPDGAFVYDRTRTEQINTMTGDVGYIDTLFSLPGKNGLDLNLAIVYDSSSGVYDIGKTRSGAKNLATKIYYESPIYNFASGWSFGFSHIKVYSTSGEGIPSTLTTSDGMSFTLDYNDLQNSTTKIRLRSNNEKFSDLTLEKHAKTVSGMTGTDNNVAYLLKYKDGKKEYFDKYGNLLYIVNRFNDRISFKYNLNEDYTSNSDRDQKYKSVDIVDTAGRVVTLERTPLADNHQTLTISIKDRYGNIADGSILFDIENVSATFSNKSIKYALKLNSITNQENMTTSFEYIPEALATYDFYKSQRITDGTQWYFPLTKIVHPTGAETQYIYDNDNAPVEGQYYKYYRVKTRRDTNDGEIYENVINFSYESDYTQDEDFSVTQTNNDGVSTRYNYAKKGINSIYTIKDSEESFLNDDSKMISKVEYSNYFKYTYPQTVKTTRYNVNTNNLKVETTQKYLYNDYRDLLKEWGAKAEGDTKNTEYMYEYEYDEVYHIPVRIAYKQNSNISVEILNTLNSEGRITKQIKRINGKEIARESYEYSYSDNPSTITSYSSANDENSGEYIKKYNVYDSSSGVLLYEKFGDTTVASYTYDMLGRVSTKTDGNGNVTEYTYDNLDRVTNIKNPDGSEGYVQYSLKDSQGAVVNKAITTDGNKNSIEYNYDMLGKITYVKNVMTGVKTAQYTYDTMGRVTSVKDGNENEYSYTYDSLGRKTDLNISNKSGNVAYKETYAYTDVDKNGYSVVTKTVGDGAKASVTTSYINKYGELEKEIQGQGSDESVTQYYYDYLGNVRASTSPNMANDKKSSRTYYTNLSASNYAGTIETVTDVYGHVVTEHKDMMGRTSKTVDALGNEVQTTYDDFGRLASKIATIDDSPSIKSYTYDNNGNVIKESVTSNAFGEDASYRNVYYEYDSMNRLVRTYTDEEGETLYEYDNNGNVIKMTAGAVDGNGGLTTTYVYDSDNRLVSSTDPMGYTESYTYDNNGNIVTKTDKNGTVIMNTYNAANNILTTVAGNDNIEYSYEPWSNRISSVTNSAGTISYEYNTKGLLTKETSTVDNTVKTYGYDKDGNRTSIDVTRNGLSVLNQSGSYNYIGQLLSVSDNKSDEILANYTYDAVGNVIEKVLGDGSQKTLYTYNECNMMKSVTNMSIYDIENEQYGTYSSYSYNYYLDGNIKDMTDNAGNVTSYVYDGAGHLSWERYDSEDGESWANRYDYDARGNRSSKYYLRGTKDEIDRFLSYSYISTYSDYSDWEDKLIESIPDMMQSADEINTYYIYDNNNRLTSQKTEYHNEWVNDVKDYTYDKNGNLTHKQGRIYYDDFAPEDAISVIYSEESTDYTYNNFNQLVGVNKNDVASSYVYDPVGQRISKTVDGVTTNHIWDNSGNIIAEFGDNEAVYSRGLNGEILCSGENEYSYNGHGDTTCLTQYFNTTLAFTGTYEYDAFGNVTSSGGYVTDDNPFRYNGQYHDDETGLIYLRNRYYDPEVGRFITEDPVKSGANWYAYCYNDPVNFVDPWGNIREPGYNADGVWSEDPDADDFGKDSAKYKLLVELGNAWMNATSESERTKLHKAADMIRAYTANVNSTSFTKAMLINAEDGANDNGHNAVMLINKAGEGVLFSYFPEGGSYPFANGQMRTRLMTATQVDSFKRSGYVYTITALGKASATYQTEHYTRYVEVSISGNEGTNMMNKGINYLMDPGTYLLVGNQCDNVASKIMAAGGKGYYVSNLPNWSIEGVSRDWGLPLQKIGG